MGWVVSAALLLDTAPSRDVLDVSDYLQLNCPSGYKAPLRGAFVFTGKSNAMGNNEGGAVAVPRKGQSDVIVRRSLSGLGLFSSREFKKGEDVIEYVGNRIASTKVADRMSRYLFQVNSRWDIDGSPRWNIARYVNHSCRPNCEAVNRKGRIFIVARRRILSGEELSYDYGPEYVNELIRPYGCRCVKCAS